MNLLQKVEMMQKDLKQSFLGSINYETIQNIATNRYLVCVDISYFFSETEEKIVLKCVYRKGFAGAKDFQYIVLHPFKLVSHDVHISNQLQFEYLKQMEKLNFGKKINGKEYISHYMAHHYPKQNTM